MRPASFRGDHGAGRVDARMAIACFVRSAAVAGLFFLAGPRAGHAAFNPISGSLSVKTSATSQQSTAATADGSLVSLNGISPSPLVELAVASQNATTVGDRLFDFTASASSTIAAPPNGSSASASVSMTQTFTTPGPRWLMLHARVVSPAGDPGVSASVSLGRTGSPAAFIIADTGGGEVHREGLFLPGAFTFLGSVNTQVASPTFNAHAGLVDGYVQIASLADFNGDGVVRAADLAQWRTGFGSTATTFSNGDVDADSDADGVDFLLWQRQMGVALSSAAANQTPEPNGALIAAATAILGATARRIRFR